MQKDGQITIVASVTSATICLLHFIGCFVHDSVPQVSQLSVHFIGCFVHDALPKLSQLSFHFIGCFVYPSILKWTWRCCRGMQHLHLLLGGLELAPVDVDSETSADDRVATQPARPEDVAIPSHVLDDALGNLLSRKLPCNAFTGEKFRSRARKLWLRERRGKTLCRGTHR